MTPSSRIRAAAGLTVAALLAACTQPPASTSPAQVTAPQPQPTPDTVMSDTGNLQEVVEVPPEPLVITTVMLRSGFASEL